MRKLGKLALEKILSIRYGILLEKDLVSAGFAETIATFPDDQLSDFLDDVDCIDNESLPVPPRSNHTLEGRKYFRLDGSEIEIAPFGVPLHKEKIIWTGYSPANGYLQALRHSGSRCVTVNSNIICLWPNRFFGYGDYLLSMFVRLAVLKSILPTSEWKNSVVAMGFPPPEYVIQSMEILGMSRDQLIFNPDTGFRLGKGYSAYIAKAPALSNYAPTLKEFDIARGCVGISNSNMQGTGKLLVLRGANDSRRLKTNLNWIENAFSEKGFESVYPGELHLSEQISTFSNAKEIAGIHGAGLANLHWANRGIKVFEWFHPKYCSACYRILTGMLKGKYCASGLTGWHVRDMRHKKSDVSPDESMVLRYLETV